MVITFSKLGCRCPKCLLLRNNSTAHVHEADKKQSQAIDDDHSSDLAKLEREFGFHDVSPALFSAAPGDDAITNVSAAFLVFHCGGFGVVRGTYTILKYNK